MRLTPNTGGVFPRNLKSYFQVLYNFSHFSWSAHFILQHLQITLFNRWGKIAYYIPYKELRFICSESSRGMPTETSCAAEWRAPHRKQGAKPLSSLLPFTVGMHFLGGVTGMFRCRFRLYNVMWTLIPRTLGISRTWHDLVMEFWPWIPYWVLLLEVMKSFLSFTL